jgi:hypothetical protein
MVFRECHKGGITMNLKKITAIRFFITPEIARKMRPHRQTGGGGDGEFPIKTQRTDGDAVALNRREYQLYHEWAYDLRVVLKADNLPESVRSTLVAKVEWIEELLGVFRESFLEQYPGNTIRAKKIAKYPDDQLATIYLDSARRKKKFELTQYELNKVGGVSQSTWNRAFTRPRFWMELRDLSNLAADDAHKAEKEAADDKERITEVLRLAEDKMIYYVQKAKAWKTVNTNVQTLADEDRADNTDRLENHISIQKLTKGQLIKGLLKEFPELHVKDLKIMDIADLRKFALQMFSPP